MKEIYATEFLNICFRPTADMGIFGGKEKIARERFMEIRLVQHVLLKNITIIVIHEI